MKRFIMVLAFLLSAGVVFAGGGYEIQPQEQRSWPQQKYEQLTAPEYKWTVTDYASVAGVFVSTIGVAGGLYLNSRRKKQL